MLEKLGVFLLLGALRLRAFWSFVFLVLARRFGPYHYALLDEQLILSLELVNLGLPLLDLRNVLFFANFELPDHLKLIVLFFFLLVIR